MIMHFEVILNGTDINPYHIYGFIQNPFPQNASYEYKNAILTVQSLGGNPIPDTDYIRKVLVGFSKEFVDLCCSKFEKGKIVRFTVTLDD